MLRASSLWQFSDKLLDSAACSHKLSVHREKPRYSTRAGASLGPWGAGRLGSGGITQPSANDYVPRLPIAEAEKGSIPRCDGLPPKRDLPSRE